ncbi:MAG: FKBP-type peptidyl-prolyl cis-trans isomerase [Flavobacteriales bacterium]
MNLVLISFTSCQSKKSDINPEQLKEPLIGANRKLVSRESQDIDAYARNRDLTMNRTGTGLRYLIIEEGEGPNPKADDQVKVHFRISLLDGTLCYDSNKSGAETFVVDHDHVESGLHEGIKLMKAGGKAKFILPSHLAHGLLGDKDKIPPLSPVVYDIELLAIN